jgi:hypothetical protein
VLFIKKKIRGFGLKVRTKTRQSCQNPVRVNVNLSKCFGSMAVMMSLA